MTDHPDQPQLPPLRGSQRVAAGAALVTGVGALVVASGLVLSSVLLVGIAVAAAALTIGATWSAITHRDAHRIAALGLAGVGLILATGCLVFLRPIMIVSFLALTALSAVCARHAIGIEPKSFATVPTPGRRVRPARRPVLLCNPASGDGAAARTGVLNAARRRGIHVVEIDGDTDLAALATREIDRGADAIGMAGGDGSLGIVASVAAERDVPFVCVPTGTRNHFALDLGLDRDNPVAALDAFGPASEQRVDLAWVNDRPFVNNVSLGVYGELVADERYRDAKVHTALEMAPTVIGSDVDGFDLRYVTPDGRTHERARMILVSNNQYTLDSSMAFGSRVSLSDALLGVVVIDTENALDREEWETDTFRVDADETVSAGVDGESVELDPPLEFRIEAGALRVRLGASAIGWSPAALARTLGSNTIVRLVRVAGGVTP